MSTQLVSERHALPQFASLDQLARRIVTNRLADLTRGEITLEDLSGTSDFGDPADLHATLRVHEPRFFRRALLGGKLSVAESYWRGEWDCDDLTALFRIFLRNAKAAGRVDQGIARLAGITHRLVHWWRDNSRAGSRRNIQAHYDLGNDFYRLWLDDTMAYSGGIFPTHESSMHEASVEKFDRACRQLDLRPEQHLLEIGSGWGGMAVHAAQNYGCRVTTTTISPGQFDAARTRIEENGLGERVQLLQQDYRDLTGRYDKLVSIEMIEAVGYRHFDTFFRKCGELLKPGGSMLLQAIVMPERGYGQYLRSVDFIQRYIFPGGCLPSLAAILESVGRATELRFVQSENFAQHYAETLRRWLRRFLERLDDVRRLGFSEEFIRLWTYYFCYCEAAFEENHVGLMQIQFDQPS
jgi:cyclopropane-fatty-acyl-phospholipid synthase